MKKNTFLGILLLSITSFTSIAQTTVIDRPLDENIAIISTKGTNGTFVAAADSFVLTEEIAIGEIDVPGGLKTNIQYLGDLEVGFNIYIYEDNNGFPAGDPSQPGTGIVELADIDPVYYSKYENGLKFYNRTDFNNIQITAANGGEQVILEPGTYWVSFFVTVEGAPDYPGKWAWIGSTAVDPLPPFLPVFIDPNGIFGGYANWTPVGNFPSCAWTLRSEPILETEDNALLQVAIYPNPSFDVVNVSIPSSIEIYESSLIDITGKQINEVRLDNGVLDISMLSKGVYILNIETSEGPLTKRIIRE